MPLFLAAATGQQSPTASPGSGRAQQDRCRAVQSAAVPCHAQQLGSPERGRARGSELAGTSPLLPCPKQSGFLPAALTQRQVLSICSSGLPRGTAGIPGSWLSQGQGCQPLTALSPAPCNSCQDLTAASAFAFSSC